MKGGISSSNSTYDVLPFTVVICVGKLQRLYDICKPSTAKYH